MRVPAIATGTLIALGALAAAAGGQTTVSTYEDLTEGFKGASFTYNGVTYRDVNQVEGVSLSGEPFSPDDPFPPGDQVIVERAVYLYDDFPDFGSPVNALTFGNTFIPGDNLSVGPLASVWMDLESLSNAVSFNIAYYENGPWGGAEYWLEAFRDGDLVGSTSFVITSDDPNGRDNATFSTMSLDGVEFDQLHLYAWKDGNYTLPRGMIDDLTITAVPEPTTAIGAVLGGGLLALRRRRA